MLASGGVSKLRIETIIFRYNKKNKRESKNMKPWRNAQTKCLSIALSAKT